MEVDLYWKYSCMSDRWSLNRGVLKWVGLKSQGPLYAITFREVWISIMVFASTLADRRQN